MISISSPFPLVLGPSQRRGEGENDAPPQVAAHELFPRTVCPDAEWQSKTSLTSGRGTTDPLEELTPAHRCRRASIGTLQGENTVAKAIRFCETGGRRSCAGRESRSAIPAAARSACVRDPAGAGGLHRREPNSPGSCSSASPPGRSPSRSTSATHSRTRLQAHRDLESGLGIGSSVLNL